MVSPEKKLYAHQGENNIYVVVYVEEAVHIGERSDHMIFPSPNLKSWSSFIMG